MDQTAPVKSKRGRPPGSKNKIRQFEDEPEQVSAPQPVLAAKPAEPPSAAAQQAGRFKMRAKPNWEEMNPLDEETPDKFRIPDSVRAKLPTDLSFQWVRHTVYGQEDPQWRGGFEKTGWTPVHPEDFDGVFDGVFMRRGDTNEINVGGMVLMARPRELTDKAKRQRQRDANEPIMVREQALLSGDIGVTLDATHKSALRNNRIGKSFEGGFQQLSVPEK